MAGRPAGTTWGRNAGRHQRSPWSRQTQARHAHNNPAPGACLLDWHVVGAAEGGRGGASTASVRHQAAPKQCPRSHQPLNPKHLPTLPSHLPTPPTTLLTCRSAGACACPPATSAWQQRALLRAPLCQQWQPAGLPAGHQGGQHKVALARSAGGQFKDTGAEVGQYGSGYSHRQPQPAGLPAAGERQGGEGVGCCWSGCAVTCSLQPTASAAAVRAMSAYPIIHHLCTMSATINQIAHRMRAEGSSGGPDGTRQLSQRTSMVPCCWLRCASWQLDAQHVHSVAKVAGRGGELDQHDLRSEEEGGGMGWGTSWQEGRGNKAPEGRPQQHTQLQAPSMATAEKDRAGSGYGYAPVQTAPPAAAVGPALCAPAGRQPPALRRLW